MLLWQMSIVEMDHRLFRVFGPKSKLFVPPKMFTSLCSMRENIGACWYHMHYCFVVDSDVYCGFFLILFFFSNKHVIYNHSLRV